MTFSAHQYPSGDERPGVTEGPRNAPTSEAGFRARSGFASLLRSSRRYWLPGVLAALVAVYLASGFYVVEADERAVVRRFGAVAAQVGPGMHYRLPWPVDRVDVVKTTSVMKVGIL